MTRFLALLALAAAALPARAQPDVSHSCYDNAGNPISCGESERRNVARERREWEEFLMEQRARSEAEARQAAERRLHELEAAKARAERERRHEDADRLRRQVKQIQDYALRQEQQRSTAEYVRKQRSLEQTAQMALESQRVDRQRRQLRAPRVMTAAQAKAALAADQGRDGWDNYLVGLRVHGHASFRNVRKEIVDLGSGDAYGLLTWHSGDTVWVDQGSRLELLLPDGTTFTLGENSEMSIDKFVYNPDPSENLRKLGVRLTKGALRWVETACLKSGGCENPSRLKLGNEIGVGVRGTDFESAVDEQGNASIKLFTGAVDVTDADRTVSVAPGQIVVVHPRGGIDGPRAMQADELSGRLPVP